MEDILKALANGRVETCTCFYQKGADYDKAIKLVTEKSRALEALLDEPGKKLLDELDEARCKLDYLSGTDRFIYGYRLGVLMMTEVFAGRDGLVLND